MRAHRITKQSAFTLVELVVAIGIVLTLMGMVLGVQRYAQTKSFRSRAEAQLAGFISAMESYKADNAVYPRSLETDSFDSMTMPTAENYTQPNQALYMMLSGDSDLNGKPDSMESKPDATPVYLSFVDAQLKKTTQRVEFIRDPWGNAYGYSTKRAAAVANGADDVKAGHNITFDLWSSAGQERNDKAWISNW